MTNHRDAQTAPEPIIMVDGDKVFGPGKAPDSYVRYMIDDSRFPAWHGCMTHYDRAAAPARAGMGAVKPLVWTEYETDGWADRADAEAGSFGVFYNIDIQPDGYHVVFDREAVGAIGTFDTADEAKAAAQADYERRILAALQPGEAQEDDRTAALQRVRQIALQSETAPLSMCEIIKRENGFPTREATPPAAQVTVADAIAALKAMPTRTEALGGQDFKYIQLGEALDTLRALAGAGHPSRTGRRRQMKALIVGGPNRGQVVDMSNVVHTDSRYFGCKFGDKEFHFIVGADVPNPHEYVMRELCRAYEYLMKGETHRQHIKKNGKL